VRIEGYSYPSSHANVVPLKLYFSDARGDNFLTATQAGEQSAQAAGYRFVRIEGYVLPNQQPNTVALKTFWSPAREDNFATATATGEQDAVQVGYQFIRTEGYVSSTPTGVVIDLDSDLGANHYMATRGVLTGGGHIDATTRTRTLTWLGGFRGGVQILVNDANDIIIGATQIHTFGVDGTAIGRSDRTDYWSEDLDPQLAARTTGIHVLHFWSPSYQAPANIIGGVSDAVQRGLPAAQAIANIVRGGNSDGK